jgi:predicted nucleic acid-binding Zn finger protein
MISDVFKRKRSELFGQLKQSGALTSELERAVVEVYGGRGKRALEVVKLQHVVKRGRRWFVRGKTDEYEVVRDFCTCRDYVLNIATEKAGVDMCYHALAKNICEILNSYYVLEHES